MGTYSKTLIRPGAGAACCILAFLGLFPSIANPGGSPADRFLNQENAGTPVTLSVTATDSQGNPVHDLEKGDFSLLEDGQPQEIVQFAKGPDPLTLTLVVERRLFDWVPDRQLLTIQGFLDRIGSRRGIALVVFDRLVDLACPLTADAAKVGKALRQITRQPKASGGALRDALHLALRDVVSAQAGRKAVLVLTYGHWDESVTSWTRLISLASTTDAGIYVISSDLLRLNETLPESFNGLGMPRERFFAAGGPEAYRNGRSTPFWWNDISSTHSAALIRTLRSWQIENHRSLAEVTGGRFEIIPQSEIDMRAPLERLAEEMDHQYVLTYRAGPRNRALTGSRTLEIRVGRPGVTVRSRRAIDFTQMPWGVR